MYAYRDDCRLFPGSKNSHFGNKAKCKTFLKLSLNETKSFSYQWLSTLASLRSGDFGQLGIIQFRVRYDR